MENRFLLKYSKPTIQSLLIDTKTILIMASKDPTGGNDSGNTGGRGGRKSATIDVEDINYNQFNEDPFN